MSKISDKKNALIWINIIIKEFQDLRNINKIRVSELENMNSSFSEGALAAIQARDITYINSINKWKDIKIKLLEGKYDK